MPYYMYVAVNEDNKISVFTVDPESGGLTHRHDVAAPGGPFTLAVSPDRNHLYCGTRETPRLTSFRIDQSGGGLTQTGRCRWTRGRSTSTRTGGAGSCCHPITREHGCQCTPSGTTGRWEEPQSYRWKRRPGLTRCRPTRPTATLLFLTSRETAPTRSGSSGSTRTRAKSPPTLRRQWNWRNSWGLVTSAFILPWMSSTSPTSRVQRERLPP